MDYPELKQSLDLHVLKRMIELNPENHEWVFPLKRFQNEWITWDMARAICRDLTNRKLCFLGSGLFNDEGEVAGSGYGITQKGRMQYGILLMLMAN